MLLWNSQKCLQHHAEQQKCLNWCSEYNLDKSLEGLSRRLLPSSCQKTLSVLNCFCFVLLLLLFFWASLKLLEHYPVLKLAYSHVDAKAHWLPRGHVFLEAVNRTVFSLLLSCQIICAMQWPRKSILEETVDVLMPVDKGRWKEL